MPRYLFDKVIEICKIIIRNKKQILIDLSNFNQTNPSIRMVEKKMDKTTCLNGTINRLNASITFLDEEGETNTVSAVSDYQAGHWTVKFNDQTLGSWITRSGNRKDLSGDGSQARLFLSKGKDLVIRQEGIYPSYASSLAPKWEAGIKETPVCNLDDIIKMEFETSSGWRGECYPERVYEEGTEDQYPCPYDESQWLIVFHRSTGAVTIEREFPFEE